MKIGFIGLGHMGAGIASNLLKAGHEVTVYNRTSSKADALVAQGAHLAPNVAEACRGEIIMTMLADDHAVEDIALGDKGIAASLAKGAVHVSSSTISAAMSERLTGIHAKNGQHFVAAPVLGRPDMAAAAKLFVIVAGPQAALALCEPVFNAIGQRTFVIGETPKTANIVKLSCNFLIASAIEALSEAMALIGKAGINQRQYLDLLTSTLFTAPVYKTYGELIVEQKFTPAGFAAPLGYKDVRLALAAAEGLQVPMPLASLLRDRFMALIAQGGEAFDWSAISQLAMKDSGQSSG